VIGRSSVFVVDARDAKVEKTPAGGLHSGRDLKLTVLRAGQKFSWK
jgi:hypothetical protein